jgi:acyl-CoA dehydrogenase
MDFSHSTRSVELQEQLRRFIVEAIDPIRADLDQHRTQHPTQPDPLITKLQEEAKAAGLWNLCIRDPAWGPGLSFVDYAPLAEIMGADRVAQEATNCAAPSNINADALIPYGSDEQKGRWLEPQLAGRIRSAFAMTEPDAASSDAANISLSAVERGDGSWVLSGRKWYISGVLDPLCAYLLVMACTDPEAPSHGRHTVFLVPLDTPGLRVVRDLPKFGFYDHGGHVELAFDDVVVSSDAIVGQVGGGFAIGQARLGPARVQHCMRSIGIAEDALSRLCRRADARSTFGLRLSDRSNIWDWIADARIQIEAARLLTLRTAWLMDTAGDKAAAEQMSILKVHVLDTVFAVVDRAVQVHGAAGVSDDTPLANWYANLRSLKIADGPEEVHRMAIARRELRRNT